MIQRPSYDGKGFYNIHHSIVKYFGGLPAGKPLDFDIPQKDGLALFLFDALGISTIEAAGVSGLEYEEITSVFPSTTATALTTLFTGKKPSEHGVLGFQTFVREMGGVVNMLGVAHPSGPQLPVSYDKLVGPSIRLGNKLANLGVNTTAILPKAVSNTPMSNFDDEGFKRIIPYYDYWDLSLIVQRELERPGQNFLYVYVPYVDTLSHHYGPYSEEAKSAVRDLMNFFARISKSKNYTVLATADHGQVEVDPATPPPPEMMSLLEVPPFGDSRAMFLKTRYREKLLKYLSDNFPDFEVLSKEEVLEMGLIGDKATPYEERLGDLLALPQGRRLLIYSYSENNDSMSFKGHHGGLSPEEVKIPLFVARCLASVAP